MARPWESIIIGFIGGLVACTGCTLLLKLRVDDPVGCVPTHAFASVWGLIAVGLFAEKETSEKFSDDYGVFKGGRWKMLGVQVLATIAVTVWAAITTFLLLMTVNRFFDVRMSLEQELEGADKWEHGIGEDDTLPLTEVNDNLAIVDIGSEEENENHPKNISESNVKESGQELKKPKIRSKIQAWKRRINTRSQAIEVQSDGITNGEALPGSMSNESRATSDEMFKTLR